MNRRPKLSIFAPAASPEEAAAIVAALEQFMRQTAPTPVAAVLKRNAWQHAALQEGVARQPQTPLPWD
jgi:predicted transcriptional regulator